MKNLLMAVLTTSLLTACANSELATKQIDNAASQQAAQTNMTAEQAVSDARTALIQANNERLPYFTPLHFKGVQASLDKIEALQKQQLAGQNDANEILIITEAFKMQKLISEAYQVKTTIENLLSQSLAHKNVLDELGAKKEFPKAYNNINDDLIALFKLIEQNKVDKALKNEADLLEEMVEIEVDTLVNIYVKPAQFILDKAEDFDADDYAEKTFEHAELAIQRAEQFIAANSRNLVQVKEIGDEAILAAQRALNVGQFAKTLVELDEQRAEIKALEMEALLEDIIRGFSVEGLAGLTLQEQSQELARLARTQNRQIKELNAQVASLAPASEEPVATSNERSVESAIAEVESQRTEVNSEQANDLEITAAQTALDLVNVEADVESQEESINSANQ